MKVRQKFAPVCCLLALGLLTAVSPVSAQRPLNRFFAGDPFMGSCDSCGPAPIMQEGVYSDPIVDGGDVVYEGGIEEVGGCASCGDPMCDGCGIGTQFSVGVELTFLKPHFENNAAFTLLQGDGATTETFTDTQFDYSTELAPRIWLEFLQNGPLGLRIGYWQFDESAAVNASPPDNGFGRISHPVFGTVDLSTTVPGSNFAATSSLNAYNIDIEGTKAFDCGMWAWMASAGLRVAEVEQTYAATLTNAAGDQQGNLQFLHQTEGFGPTISLRTQRPFGNQFALFGMARGSLLFGDGSMSLIAVEDEDLANQLMTNMSSIRDDILPIGEVQVGLQWTPANCGAYFPYMHLALEGQLWQGVGNSSSEDGNLGFFGFNFAMGFDW